MNKEQVKISKFLSLVLRHKPEAIGLNLDSQGWADIDELIECARRDRKVLNKEMIYDIVANNDKKRFALSEDRQKIRASQGHSIKVDLGLMEIEPPEYLFHGTAIRFLNSIKDIGLKPRGRHHVHLSIDYETAAKVGQRHGKPVVLKIYSGKMHVAGHKFFKSANNIWLTEEVSPAYIDIVDHKISESAAHDDLQP
jgi:putative RNA 2'-phosphotransferase